MHEIVCHLGWFQCDYPPFILSIFKRTRIKSNLLTISSFFNMCSLFTRDGHIKGTHILTVPGIGCSKTLSKQTAAKNLLTTVQAKRTNLIISVVEAERALIYETYFHYRGRCIFKEIIARFQPVRLNPSIVILPVVPMLQLIRKPRWQIFSNVEVWIELVIFFQYSKSDSCVY